MMILTLLITLFSGAVSGTILSGMNPELLRPVRRRMAEIPLLILTAGLIFDVILGQFDPTRGFHYSAGTIPVLFGLYFLGLYPSASRSDSGWLRFLLKFQFPLNGNVFLLAVFCNHYSFSSATVVLIFLFFGIITVATAAILNVILHKKRNENVKDILQFSEILNGIFLVITGLVVFTGQITIFEYVLERII